MTRKFEDIGISTSNILIPNKEVNLSKWSIIACDQYTSNLEYWKKVEKYVSNEYSTLEIIIPECYLENNEIDEKIKQCQKNMKKYIQNNIFNTIEDSFIYVKRQIGDKIRKGIVLEIDLEKYDYSQDSTSLIRATEKTILERIPPRVKVRENALIESPHIMVLIDDPENIIFGGLDENKLKQCYDFNLMFNCGHISGFVINNVDKIVEGLRSLKKDFISKHNTNNPLLYAMGDGNHSLATAKTVWENIKKDKGMNHPARYALVEIVNIHDKSLVFEPIHRIALGINADTFLDKLQEKYNCHIADTTQNVANDGEFIVVGNNSKKKIIVNNKNGKIEVGITDEILDSFDEIKVDYIHEKETVLEKESKNDEFGIILPKMLKEDLFLSILNNGSLPRKTFSMGEANEKRFYLECRKIQ